MYRNRCNEGEHSEHQVLCFCGSINAESLNKFSLKYYIDLCVRRVKYWAIIQYITIQYHSLKYNTLQYNTTHYSTIQYNTLQYNTIQYNTVQNKFASKCVAKMETSLASALHMAIASLGLLFVCLYELCDSMG